MGVGHPVRTLVDFDARRPPRLRSYPLRNLLLLGHGEEPRLCRRTRAAAYTHRGWRELVDLSTGAPDFIGRCSEFVTRRRRPRAAATVADAAGTEETAPLGTSDPGGLACTGPHASSAPPPYRTRGYRTLTDDSSNNRTPTSFVAAGVVIVLAARWFLRDFVTGDVQFWVAYWYDHLLTEGLSAFQRELPNADGWNQLQGSYPPTYYYLLYLATWFDNLMPRLYLIKLVSISFDFVAAFFAFKIVLLSTANRRCAWLAAYTLLMAPTSPARQLLLGSVRRHSQQSPARLDLLLNRSAAHRRCRLLRIGSLDQGAGRLPSPLSPRSDSSGHPQMATPPIRSHHLLHRDDTGRAPRQTTARDPEHLPRSRAASSVVCP